MNPEGGAPASNLCATPPVALITGGQGDLAKAISHALRDAGYETLTPGRDRLDVARASSVASYFSSIKRLHLLVNNAGSIADAHFGRLTENDWDCVVDTHLKGSFLCAKAAAIRMLKSGGHIVNMGSFSALSPPVGQANYATAKAGIIGLTKSLAAELGPRNIRVNCILPGFLETKMTRGIPPAARHRALAAHALGRFNTPEDAARFLVSLDSLQHVSGQIFQLDSRLSP